MTDIVFLGDIVVDEKIKDFKWNLFKNSYVIANLEGGLKPPSNKVQKEGKISLFSTVNLCETLRKIGVNCVTLSNNHIADYGDASIELTQESLHNAGISYFGAGTVTEAKKAFVVEIDGVNIGFLAMVTQDCLPILVIDNNKGVIEFDEDIVKEQVRKLRKQVDYVVVYIHWGLQLIPIPPPNCVLTGRKLVNAGVDLIIGSHPHTVQGYEIYKGKYIFYSLGNFYFDGIWTLFHGEPVLVDHPSVSLVSIAPVFTFSYETIRLNDIRVFKQRRKGELTEYNNRQKKKQIKHLGKISKRIGKTNEKKYSIWLEAYRLKKGLIYKLRNITKLRLKKRYFAKLWKLVAFYVGRTFLKLLTKG